MVVMKFGGTSIIDASRMKEVSKIIMSDHTNTRPVVVLSAMKGTTEDLLESAEKAMLHNGEKAYLSLYKKIVRRHKTAWKELLPNNTHAFPEEASHILLELEEILHGIHLIQECTARTQDLLLSFGERLSCVLFAAYLNTYGQGVRAEVIDARNCIITDDRHGSARVFFSMSYKNIKTQIKHVLHTPHCIPVVTGFIASTQQGVTTTLGRNGSDYTAALVGAAIDADRIEIWTDVDGVLSADPRTTSKAFVVSRISYSEAMELSYFGAKVIHPQTVVPAIEKQVPLIIKNTLNPKGKGTVITKNGVTHAYPITGLASVKDVSLLTIEGAGLSGNFYFLPDVFNAFALHHVQPLMITQSSSEHSISFVLKMQDAESMKQVLEEIFKRELEAKSIQNILVKKNTSIISVIGSHMKGTRGLAGRIFSAMGAHDINVIAISQGSNEINVSFVVDKKVEKEAIKILHTEFFEKKDAGARK